jgi:mediator of RNA polymerase II transcription subunit 21
LTQLSTQLYASLRYLTSHHTSSPLPSQPPSLPSDINPAQLPDSPQTFESAKRELAQDLVFKAKQIEYLVGRLPGVENSKEAQEGRIAELEEVLRKSERERSEGVGEREAWIRRLDGVLEGVRR